MNIEHYILQYIWDAYGLPENYKRIIYAWHITNCKKHTLLELDRHTSCKFALYILKEILLCYICTINTTTSPLLTRAHVHTHCA